VHGAHIAGITWEGPGVLPRAQDGEGRLGNNSTATINVNDLVCWNNTCKTNIYDLPLYFDGSHFSQLFIHFVAPLWLQRARHTVCASRFEAALVSMTNTTAKMG
jgi:hypothetical protein